MRRQLFATVTLSALLLMSIPVMTASIQLVPFVSGLSAPVVVTHAHDGRLFIVEQYHGIKVLQPGATTPTVFLDISAKLAVNSSERGLLGLAFHPQFPTNPRFYVDYTRASDGATVIS